MDLRERVAAALAQPGRTLQSVATQFAVSLRFVSTVRARQRQTGSVAALPSGRGPAPRLDEAAQQALVGLVAAQPDATLAELGQQLQQAGYPLVSTSTLCQRLQQLGWGRKKNGTRQRTGPA